MAFVYKNTTISLSTVFAFLLIIGYSSESYSQATMPDELINKPASNDNKRSTATNSAPSKKRALREVPPAPPENTAKKFIGSYSNEFNYVNSEKNAINKRVFIQLFPNPNNAKLLQFRETTTSRFIDPKLKFACSKANYINTTSQGLASVDGDIITLNDLTSPTECSSPTMETYIYRNGNLQFFDSNNKKLTENYLFRQ